MVDNNQTPKKARRVIAICLALTTVLPSTASATDTPNDIVYLKQNTFGTNPLIGQAELSTMRTDGENKQTLTNNIDQFQVSWSPDGNRIAYASNGDIYTADPDGTNTKRLTTDGATKHNEEPDYSPDGTQIAFTRTCGTTPPLGHCVFTMNTTDGTNITQITQTTTADTKDDSAPDYSPNGTQIAYARAPQKTRPTDKPEAEIYTVTTTTKTENKIIGRKNLDPFTSIYDLRFPAWSPDGTKIAYQAKFESLIGDDPTLIFTSDADGSNQKRVTYSEDRFNGQPAWSPDGHSIAYVSDEYSDFPIGKRGSFSRDNQLDIVVRNLDTNKEFVATTDPGLETAPAWRERTRTNLQFSILFERGPSGSRDIFSTRADGTGPEAQLTKDPADDYAAVWSPGHDRVAFISTRDGRPHLYVMDADGSNIEKWGTVSGAYNTPTWDDKYSVIVAINTGMQSDLYRVTGRFEHQLTKTDYDETCPDNSPDGKKVAFQSNEPGREEIYTVDGFDFSVKKRLTTTPSSLLVKGASKCPSYSPDGTKIAFERTIGHLTEIATINANDGTGRRTIPTKFPDYEHRPIWSPAENNYLAFTYESGDIYTIRPDGTDQTPITTNGLATSWR